MDEPQDTTTAPVIESPPSPQTTQAPPTTPPAGPTSPFSGLSAEEKDRMLAQQAQVIRENARKQAEYEAKLRSFDERLNRPPEPSKGDQTKAFFDDPVNMIRKELNDTVKPLIEFKDQFQKQSKYEQIKSEFKGDARYREFLALPGIEATVDKLMATMPSTPESMYSVILGVRGGMEFGDIPKPSGGTAGGTTRPQDTTTPPHLRPTPPPLPEPDKKGDDSLKAKVAALDENARRLAREWGMSPEQYVQWQDEEKVNVASSKIGIPEKKDDKK